MGAIFLQARQLKVAKNKKILSAKLIYCVLSPASNHQNQTPVSCSVSFAGLCSVNTLKIAEFIRKIWSFSYLDYFEDNLEKATCIKNIGSFQCLGVVG